MFVTLMGTSLLVTVDIECDINSSAFSVYCSTGVIIPVVLNWEM